MVTMSAISQRRFDALAGYTRLPSFVVVFQEAGWFATDDERLLGVITWDRIDRDYGWVVLGRDQRRRFKGIAHDVSLPSFDEARTRLEVAITEHAALPDESYHQGSDDDPPVDFFTPVVPTDRLNPIFSTLTGEPRYSPAREIIAAMMPFFDDMDGNFIEQFQTRGFDARLWELYLYAAFTEIGYAQEEDAVVPDLLLKGPLGRVGVEATTVNPPDHGELPPRDHEDSVRAYIEHYVPIKIARALTRKLYHKTRYWSVAGMEDRPFVIALQDFHAPASMSRLILPATEYIFGVRHERRDGALKVTRLTEHVYKNAHAPSHFFGLPEAENVSAVMLNPLGTITKFNRLGYISGFGDRRVRMIRSGLRRGELDPGDPRPKPFDQDVRAPDYAESWIEGAVILHNPNARIPLYPDLIPGAAHEFLQPDGSILSMLPDFHPYISRTLVTIDDDPAETSE